MNGWPVLSLMRWWSIPFGAWMPRRRRLKNRSKAAANDNSGVRGWGFGGGGGGGDSMAWAGFITAAGGALEARTRRGTVAVTNSRRATESTDGHNAAVCVCKKVLKAVVALLHAKSPACGSHLLIAKAHHLWSERHATYATH